MKSEDTFSQVPVFNKSVFIVLTTIITAQECDATMHNQGI